MRPPACRRRPPLAWLLLCSGLVPLAGCRTAPAAPATRVKAASSRGALGELAWLVGSWRGERDGSVLEERWTRELGGAMLGSFRAVAGAGPRFYELMVIERDPRGVVLRLRHFGPRLSAWEEKDGALAYRLRRASASGTEAVFENEGSDRVRRIAYRRAPTARGDGLTITLLRADGQPAGEFRFVRVR
jgi:hypothetical protein